MSKSKHWIAIVCCMLSFLAHADSTQQTQSILKLHSPKKASIYSAVLPGLGQAYNKKYWKIPLVYATLGLSSYYMLSNRDSFKVRQAALINLSDNDSTTKASWYFTNMPISALKAQRTYYRTNRDYGIIAIAAFYVLNIIDAAVDAHFYQFNIDKPLAIQKRKPWHVYSSVQGGKQQFGIRWEF